jgi:hypothetical protein
MPSREHSRTTPDRSVFGTNYRGDPGRPQVERRKTKNFGKPGYGECPSCGNWAFIKPNGELRSHLTGGLANVTCVYVGIPKGFRFIERVTYEIVVNYVADVVLSDEHYETMHPSDHAISAAVRKAVAASIPDVLMIPTDGAALDIKITGVHREVESIEPETKETKEETSEEDHQADRAHT